MKIILNKDISNLGEKDDIVNVKDGYGVNYLIPKGLAKVATKSALKVHAENKKQRAHKEAKIIEEAKEAVKKLEDTVLKIGAKTSTKGKIFGSVNTIQIAEELRKEGIDIDRKNISIKEENIKEVGTYTANIKLHKEVKTEIKFEVIAE